MQPKFPLMLRRHAGVPDCMPRIQCTGWVDNYALLGEM